MSKILMGSVRAAIVAALLCLTSHAAHAQMDVLQVIDTRTVLGTGAVVPIDASGNLIPSAAGNIDGIFQPTTTNAYQYAIRERLDTQQVGQAGRVGYSFFTFDVLGLTASPTDPNFSAIFTIDYEGHLNALNGGFNVDLGQVNGAWDSTGANDPTVALGKNSTSLGSLIQAVDTEPNAIAGLSLDITALVQGWADGSIANNGLTFNAAEIPQAAYFSNAVITTSIEPIPEPSSIGLLGLAMGGLVMRRKRR